MGWGGFDFGKALRHLRDIGVTSMTWCDGVLTVEPAEARAKVHTDIIYSLRRGAPARFSMTLEG